MTVSTQVRPAAGRTCSKAFPNARRHIRQDCAETNPSVLCWPALRQPSHSLSFAPAGLFSPIGWPTHNPLQKMRQRGSPTRAVWPEDRQEDTPFGPSDTLQDSQKATETEFPHAKDGPSPESPQTCKKDFVSPEIGATCRLGPVGYIGPLTSLVRIGSRSQVE
jgi:hypothetical protein